MGFVLTLIYISITLISPAALPPEIASLHIALIVGVITILTVVWAIGGSRLLQLPDPYLGLGLLAASTLSTLATGWLTGTLNTFLTFVPTLITFYFVSITCNNLRRLKILTYFMVFAAFFVLLQGISAEYTHDVMSKYVMTELYTDPATLANVTLLRIRGLGEISDPNDLGQLLVMLIPLLWLRWKKGHLFTNVLFTLVPAGILTVGLYYTHSRGGALALIAVILYGFKDRIGIFGSAVIGALGVAALVAVGFSGGRGMGDDDGGRVALWGEGLQMLKKHPILGIGPSRFGEFSSSGLTAHNSFILGMVELGMVGYFFWMGMLFTSWTGLSRLIQAQQPAAPEEKSTAPARVAFQKSKRVLNVLPQMVHAPAGVAGMMTHSSVQPSFPALASNGARKSSFSVGRFLDPPEDEQPTPEELAYAAKILRISFVGLLAAGFFLSRTYAVTLYILLGMAVSVIKMSQPLPEVDFFALLKKVTLACFVSVVVLYLVVRLHFGAR